MTVEQKMQAIRETMAQIRRTIRGNGGVLPAKAGPALMADQMLVFNANNVRTLWTDINTIDAVKNVIYNDGYWRQIRNTIKAPDPLDLSAEQLMEYEVNDPRLTEGLHSWAVVRITKVGTEVVTYGGNFYEAYVKRTVTNPETGEQMEVVEQSGDIFTLPDKLRELDAAWLGVEYWSCEPGKHTTYTEGGVEYHCVPCDLPTDRRQYLAVHLYTEAGQLDYTATNDDYITDDAMLQLPGGIYYITDNSQLESAPAGLLVPVGLADRIQIDYSLIADPLQRLRLVGDSFGDEYVISVIDGNTKMEGTWNE